MTNRVILLLAILIGCGGCVGHRGYCNVAIHDDDADYACWGSDIHGDDTGDLSGTEIDINTEPEGWQLQFIRGYCVTGFVEPASCSTPSLGKPPQ